MDGRLNFIDIMKGLGIVMVVILHVGSIGIDSKIFIECWWLFLMPMFFVLSGYFFSEKPFKIIIKKKVNGLIIPWLFFFLPTILYNSIYFFLNPNINLIYIWDNSSIHNDPLWFITCLFTLNIILYIILKYTKQLSLQIFIVILISLLGSYLRKDNSYSIHVVNPLYYLSYFYLGFILKKYSLFNFISPKRSLLCILVYLLIAIPYQFNLKNAAYLIENNYLLFFIGATSGTLTLGSLCKKCEKFKLFIYLGKNSLLILGLHMYVLFFLHRGLKIENPYLLTTLCLAILIPIIVIINRYFPWINGKGKILSKTKPIFKMNVLN